MIMIFKAKIAIPSTQQLVLGWQGAFTVTLLGTRFELCGGPFARAPARGKDFYLVKMASEQAGAADLTVAIKDFTAPSPAQLLNAVEHVLNAVVFGHKIVYVGCGAGIGRTGTLLAAVLKVFYPNEDPVKLVRQHYLSYAVETPEQKKLLADLPVKAIRRRLLWNLLKKRISTLF